MDPFALQEEMDAARTLRSRGAPSTNSGTAGGASTANNNESNTASRASPTHHSNHRRRRPGGKDGEGDGLNGATSGHEGLSAEVRLRQKYVMFDDIIVGRGGFGEVFLGKRLVDRTNGIRHKVKALPELTITNTANQASSSMEGGESVKIDESDLNIVPDDGSLAALLPSNEGPQQARMPLQTAEGAIEFPSRSRDDRS